MNRYILRTLMLALVWFSGNSCSGLLEEKPDLSLVRPTTLDELWALLDNNRQVMNGEPCTVDIVSDDVYLLETLLPSLSEDKYRIYTWSKEPVEGGLDLDWS
ncbi:hypothetical protein, partial [Algoriphagus resistens]|uniref:hypothetical protein n=1 Tax=Algoriphagus resistens TaxID=1750590 RepID=UPI000AA7D6D6